MNKFRIILLFLVIFLMVRPIMLSHCEVPCGIYNDPMRFTMLEEHIKTIKKAIQEIQSLSGQDPMNMNQIVRWITNKEKHAEEIQRIISQYFLTQRIKMASSEDSQAQKTYIHHLTLCHEILVLAMKTKQTTDLGNVENLAKAVQKFKQAYLPAPQ